MGKKGTRTRVIQNVKKYLISSYFGKKNYINSEIVKFYSHMGL